MRVRNIVDQDFEERVLQSPRPVVVAFKASWCLPSQQLVSVIDEVADEYSKRQVRFVAVDADDKTEAIRTRYKVKRLPETMLFNNGRPVDCIGGLTTKESISSMIDSCIQLVLKVDEFNFETEVLDSKIPVLVHFDAAWCEASQNLVSIVDQTAKKFEGRTKVVRVNFGPETARLCSRFGVRRVPELSLFVNGVVEDRILGGKTSIETITRMLEAFIL